ncbi:MAG TPA: M48 family metallopeptidase, partial [Nitrospiria bacterium]|nr:M48 family metallopeptidase [Nitrospiria bacterium]
MTHLKPMKRIIRGLPGTGFLIISLLLSACQTVPVTGRQQFLMISGEEEVQLGEEAYRNILAESRLSGDAAQVALLKKVGGRIASVAEKQDYDWEFNLIEDETPNAFALPGGKVAFYTGILKFTQSETGLAVVMGHEVAHALAHHGVERMSTTILTQIGAAAAAQALGRGDPEVTQSINNAFGIGGQVGILLPFSRKHESEADQIGLVLMARAGYDPREAAEFWKRMSGGGGQAPPEFMSTHPSD